MNTTVPIREDGDAKSGVSGLNRRRSTRVLLRVPIVIRGLDSDGQDFEAQAETIVVSKHGARIRAGRPLPLGSEIIVAIPKTSREERAKVVWKDEQAPDQYAIALQHPENLWGISFPPEDWSDATIDTNSHAHTRTEGQLELRLGRRREERFPATGEAIVRSGSRVIYGEVADISHSGFRIRYRGTPVQLGPQTDVSYPWGRVKASPVWFRMAGEWVEIGFKIIEFVEADVEIPGFLKKEG